MKYKVLLAGNSNRLISDFFMHMDSSFECLTSSLIYEDLKRHLQYFKPDIFVYCMRSETRDDIMTVSSFGSQLKKDNVPFAAIADSSSIDFLSKIPGCRPDITLKMPINSSDIEEQLSTFIKKFKANPSALSGTQDTSDMLSKIEAELALMDLDTEFDSSLLDAALNMREPEDPKKRRILVVDDSIVVHKAIKGYLEDEYEVAAAISGKVALRFLENKEVSLILLDYVMPEMDGIEMLKKLQEDPVLKKIPVIFLTGINDADRIQKALMLRPQGYLLKPVEKDDLLKKIHDVLK